jgi:hypothetical protein
VQNAAPTGEVRSSVVAIGPKPIMRASSTPAPQWAHHFFICRQPSAISQKETTIDEQRTTNIG